MEYSVTLTLFVTADNEDEAWKDFEDMVKHEQFDSDNIEIEEEYEDD